MCMYQTSKSKDAAENLPSIPCSAFMAFHQEIMTSADAAPRGGLGVHACRQGWTAYVSVTPRMGSETRDPTAASWEPGLADGGGDEKPLESLTFPSYSYIQRGPVFLCWCLVKSWPRFYFYLLFQDSKMMFPVSFQCKGTLLVRLKPDLCHVGYQCFLSPMNAFEAPFINSVLTLLWKWIEMMDLRSYLLKVKL